jgi:hypothetical protein
MGDEPDDSGLISLDPVDYSKETSNDHRVQSEPSNSA